MSRLNYKLNYNFYANIIRLIKKNYILFISFFATFFLMLALSPFITIFILIFPSFYFLYKGQYKNIFFIWFFLFSSWYLIFTFFFIGFNDTILIGGNDNTGKIFFYLFDRPFFFSFFRDFCLETVVVFHVVAEYFGINIWVPSIFKGLLYLIKGLKILVEYIFGKGKGESSAECSPDKDFKVSSSENLFPVPSPGVSPMNIITKNSFNFNKTQTSKFVYKDEAFAASTISKENLEFSNKCGEIQEHFKQTNSIWSLGNVKCTSMSNGSSLFGYNLKVPFFSSLGNSKGCVVIEGAIPRFLLNKLKDKKS